MQYTCAIFDLDGTILDTLDDLKNALNHSLKEYGYATLTREQVRTFIGNGVRNLVERSLPQGVADMVVSSIVSTFKTRYNQFIDVETHPYAGIPELLRDLKAAGVKIGVNSNKYDAAANALCAAHFPGLYDMALGEMEQIPKKPSAAGVNMLLGKLGADPKRTIYIGDSGVDWATAKNAQLPFAWVSWGFRRPNEMPEIPKNRFDSVEQLRGFLFA